MGSFVKSRQSRQSRKRANALMLGSGKTPNRPVQPRSSASGHLPAPSARKSATASFRTSPSPSAQRSEAASERSERSSAVDREVGGPVAGTDLDTTAQPCQSPAVTLQKRARSKLLTTTLASGLERLQSPLNHAYRNTLQCGAVLHQEMGRVQGKYCGNRWCLVCNRIRTAKLLQVYRPVMREWKDKHFVTLTPPNVPADKLHGTVREMLAVMPKIARALRRTDGIELRAIRKLETTYNARRNDYHPHLHLIVDSQQAAEAIVRRWLERFPDASAKGQDIRKCDDQSTVELFKYFTKLTVRGIDNKHTAPPPRALDTIFKSVKGLRTFQAMGFTAPKAAVVAEDEAILLDAGTESPSPRTGDVVDWEWVNALTDWVDFETGEVLSGYQPSPVMQELVARIERDWATVLPSG